jgi:hypothetical protein
VACRGSIPRCVIDFITFNERKRIMKIKIVLMMFVLLGCTEIREEVEREITLIEKELEPTTKEKTMKITEKLTYSDYQTPIYKDSVIDTGRKVLVGYSVICPRCKTRIPEIEHGHSFKCNCGLEMTVYGNGMECTLDIKDLKPVSKAKKVLNLLSGHIDQK